MNAYVTRPFMTLAATVAGCLIPFACGAADDDVTVSPEFPPLVGDRYVAEVPDTLDLAQRLRYSLNALSRGVERRTNDQAEKRFPATRFPVHHFIGLSENGPQLERAINIYGKAMLGARLARIATGSEERMEVDNDWRGAWLQWFQADPALFGPEGGRHLEWLAINIRDARGSNRERWQELARRAVSRLTQLAISHEDAAWIPFGKSVPDDGFTDINEARQKIEEALAKNTSAERPVGWKATWQTWTLQGLSAIYRETGDPQTLELAGRIARYLKDHSEIIAEDGRLLAGHEADRPVVHWHHSFLTAVACAEYGAVAGDEEFLEFAELIYRHGLTLGHAETGFAPEYCYGQYPREQDFDDNEGCCTSDLVHVALRLALSGQVVYWDDVERFVRNQLSALQLTDTRWFYEMPANRGKWSYPAPVAEALAGPLVGQFGGWATLNEWQVPGLGPGIQTCCLGNCTRAMYYVWHHMIEKVDGTLRVHLMLNRASPWADIHSYRPYEGRVQIHLKQDFQQVSIRVPAWIEDGSDEIVATRDGHPAPLQWNDRYVTIMANRAGQILEISFPIHQRETEAVIGRRPYRLLFKGSTLINVDPPGERIPLYERDRYRASKATLQNVERFILTDR